MGTRDIESLLRQKFPDHPWMREDIKNEVKKYRRGVLDGYTPTQALIRVFQDYDIKHSVLQVDGRVAGHDLDLPLVPGNVGSIPIDHVN